MCGRYTLLGDQLDLLDEFDLDEPIAGRHVLIVESVHRPTLVAVQPRPVATEGNEVSQR